LLGRNIVKDKNKWNSIGDCGDCYDSSGFNTAVNIYKKKLFMYPLLWEDSVHDSYFDSQHASESVI